MWGGGGNKRVFVSIRELQDVSILFFRFSSFLLGCKQTQVFASPHQGLRRMGLFPRLASHIRTRVPGAKSARGFLEGEKPAMNTFTNARASQKTFFTCLGNGHVNIPTATLKQALKWVVQSQWYHFVCVCVSKRDNSKHGGRSPPFVLWVKI